MRKRTWLVVTALVLMAALLLAGCRKADNSVKTFTLEVIHKDNSSKKITLTTTAGYLGECLQAEGIISGKEGPFGLYIHEVDGEKAVYEEDGAYWAFYEGDAYAATGIDKTPITDGAFYRLVYTVEAQG